jgi:hypothetical protein
MYLVNSWPDCSTAEAKTEGKGEAYPEMMNRGKGSGVPGDMKISWIVSESYSVF